MSKELGELVVRKCVPEEFADCDMVFSGLDSDVAGDVGMSPPRDDSRKSIYQARVMR